MSRRFGQDFCNVAVYVLDFSKTFSQLVVEEHCILGGQFSMMSQAALQGWCEMLSLCFLYH